jgi:hypothetical protein
MIELNKEYFASPYYFFLKENRNTIDVYFSVQSTLTEARKKDEKISVPKSKEKEIKSVVSKLGKQKDKKFTVNDLKKIITKVGKKKDEMTELIDTDGTMRDSSIPILDMGMHPRKTMDQTVRATRSPKPPYTGTYRVYYGESTEDEPTIQEVDYSDAFGYEETEDMDGKQTFTYLKDKMEMEPEEAYNRTKQFGKDPSGKRDKKSKYYNDKNFITRATLSEIEKQKMRKMIEDIMSKKTDDHELSQKKEASEMLKKNVKVLKKMADKEGLSLRDLMTLFKGEQ